MYDFSALTSHDFEHLCKDLLDKKWKLSLEIFKVGPDQGIDLRAYYPKKPSADVNTIIQCKNYKESGFPKLKKDVLENELPKIQKLSPTRYVVITSAPLSPKNKNELLAGLSPFCLTTADILGHDDILALLREFPEVERAHPKLWMTSTGVLEAILHQAEYNQHVLQLKQAQRNAKYYVANEVVTQKARQALNKDGYCVLSGPPGIGKTTLAEALGMAALKSEDKPEIFFVYEVNDLLKVLSPQKKQLFIWDDFLGQTSMQRDETFRKKTKQVLETIKNGSVTQLILSTREYILAEAMRVDEGFSQGRLFERRVVIDVSQYTRHDKALILYNHLYHSDITTSILDMIHREKDILKQLINHPHYNPRLIAFALQQVDNHGLTSRILLDKLKFAFDNPDKLWAQAFEALTPAAKNLLYVLTIFGTAGPRKTVEHIYSVFHAGECVRLNQPRFDADLKNSLKITEGTFTAYGRSWNNAELHGFFNPSVRDYLSKIVTSTDQRIMFENLLTNASQIGDFDLFESTVALFRNTKTSPKWAENILCGWAQRLLKDKTTRPERILQILMKDICKHCNPNVTQPVVTICCNLIMEVLGKDEGIWGNTLWNAILASEDVPTIDWLRLDIISAFAKWLISSLKVDWEESELIHEVYSKYGEEFLLDENDFQEAFEGLCEREVENVREDDEKRASALETLRNEIQERAEPWKINCRHLIQTIEELIEERPEDDPSDWEDMDGRRSDSPSYNDESFALSVFDNFSGRDK